MDPPGRVDSPQRDMDDNLRFLQQNPQGMRGFPQDQQVIVDPHQGYARVGYMPYETPWYADQCAVRRSTAIRQEIQATSQDPNTFYRFRAEIEAMQDSRAFANQHPGIFSAPRPEAESSYNSANPLSPLLDNRSPRATDVLSVRVPFNWDGRGELHGPRGSPQTAFDDKLEEKGGVYVGDQDGFKETNRCTEFTGRCIGTYPNIVGLGLKCNKFFAKACDFQGHGYLENSSMAFTCMDCHAAQQVYFQPLYQAIEQNRQAFVCGGCSQRVIQGGHFFQGRCPCFATLKASWLCHQHVNNIGDRLTTIQETDTWLQGIFHDSRVQGLNLCVACATNVADPMAEIYGCKICRFWIRK